MTEMCPCGQPLHYTDPVVRQFVEEFIAKMGETVVVTTPEGSWKVSRHYIALHGLKARDLPTLGFEKVREHCES